jgi:hypothetical protein
VTPFGKAAGETNDERLKRDVARPFARIASLFDQF